MTARTNFVKRSIEASPGGLDCRRDIQRSRGGPWTVEARFSRTGITSPFGKYDGWLERQRIESVIKARAEARIAQAFTEAGIAGKPVAEAVRDIYRVIALGPHEAARMYGDAVLVVVKKIAEMSDG